MPAVRAQAGLTDGELGTALLFVGAGALPAMLATGRAVDRWGLRVTALLLGALGVVGTLVAAFGRDIWSLSAGLALLGASSGAADVAINAAAGSAERNSGRPVITRAHGVFSAMVVAGSLATGLLSGLGLPLLVPFLLVAVAAAGAALSVLADGRAAAGVTEDGGGGTGTGRAVRLLPLLVVGGLGALAFATENAHQSWGAVYLADVADAGPALAAVGPAVFAGVVALTRFAAGSIGSRHAATVLVAGSVTAAAGTALVSVATAVPAVLTGLALAAAGTAVLFPTLAGVVAAHVDDTARGRATSVVTTVAYLGFLAGPVYVGRWADATGLPGAMVAVAALAAVLAALAWPALRAVHTGPSWHLEAAGDAGRPGQVSGRLS
ncbi:MFS family permease [Streptosporangium becharense]|uniref:MFS family permease n=1 Tax=Streptosporangium becharense TaxID=1816182 RepID=A0A7W9IEF4_9ACTN|nr:MFS transporter [Streptosporangium becharense]MBB2910100.1 MFS family permease [Streptosporangium becharense]MBB5818945.1 MFS family permease [Streptosporangium becharense]